MSIKSRRLGTLLARVDRELPELSADLRREVEALRNEAARWRLAVRGGTALPRLPQPRTATDCLRTVSRYYTDPLLDVLTLLTAAAECARLTVAYPAAEDLRQALAEFMPRYGSMEVLQRSAQKGRR